MMIFTIAARELRSLFLSPLAWSILAVVQLILAYSFLSGLDYYMQWQSQLLGMSGAPGVTEIVVTPIFRNTTFLFMLVTPLLTMRLISEERRSKTISLLFSAPVSMSEIVIGKFLGVMGFLLIMVAMITLMPLSLLLGGALDFGVLVATLLSVALLLACFAAVGFFMSTLTDEPAVAAVSTFGVELMLWIIDWAGSNESGPVSTLFAYMSVLRHFESLLRGVFDSSDVIYYLLFVTVFIGLSIRRLDADRLQH